PLYERVCQYTLQHGEDLQGMFKDEKYEYMSCKEGYHRENSILKIKKAQNAYTFIFWFTLSGWSLVLFFTGLTRQSCIYGFFLCFLGGNGSIFINNCTQKI
ncbi:hypothetical protein MLI38_021480, partial [Escherichia coli]|nr:hypothetical protein [Escherichia coli]